MDTEQSRAYLIYGPPASGKTTTGERIARTLNAEYLSVGNMTRIERTAKTPMGNELQGYLDRVEQYPVELIAQLVAQYTERVIKKGGSFLLDGFPKYSNEAEYFIAEMKRRGIPLEAVIILELAYEAALERVADRRICSSCHAQINLQDSKDMRCPHCEGELTIREGDRPENFMRRYSDHEEALAGTINLLMPHAKGVVKVNATHTLEKIVEDVISKLQVPE